MGQIKINGLLIETYDSIQDMPSQNYHQFNKYIIMATDLGNDLDAIAGHKMKLARMIAQGRTEEALIELDNYHQSIVLNVEQVDLKSMAFICLCKTIGGRVVYVSSVEKVKSYLTVLHRNRFTVGQIWDYINQVKKKLDSQLDVFFPEVGETAQSITFFQKLKARTDLVLKQIEFDYDYSEEIEKINNYLLDMYRPKVYHGDKGFEVNFTLSYEEACTVISQNTNRNPMEMSVITFFSALDTIKRQAREKQKQQQHAH